jgi:L-lactate dehydrogenase complex protein LldG
MSSKSEILKALRAGRAESAPLPELQGNWIRYDDPYAQFATMVEAVGGRCVRVANAQLIAPWLAAQPTFAAAKQFVSFVPQVAGNVQLDAIDDPHQTETVDWAVMPGQFGVAENGAIWVTDAGVRHRAIYFIVQHLALVLPSQALVHNLHEAYQQIAVGGSSLGLFISGPSKTADIEQSLVIGAHGPRSLTVFCVDNRD